MKEEHYGLGFKLFSDEDIEAIHEATLDVMGDLGVRVCGKRAHEYLSAAGCEVDGKTGMVKFPKNLVNDCIESAPEEFLMAARDPAKDAWIRRNKVTYTNFGTGIMFEDPYTGERRDTTKEDLGLIARVCDAVDEVDQFTIAVTARDVPEAVKDLHEAEAVFNNTSKHFGHDVGNAEMARYVIRMAELIAGGKEYLRKRPILCLGMCPVSPLELHEDGTDIIIEAALAGLPLDILSMAMTGASSPATIPGTLVVMNSEFLSGLVLSQLANKGNSVLYGTSSTIMDMRYMTSPVGAPEHAMIGAAVAQLGQYYKIPVDTGGT